VIQEAAPSKDIWLVAIALVVATIGIINSMLMAVTERYKEIGTMKCLGALDRFVLRLFILEAGMQGLAGAAVGALAGTLFALAGGLARFGLAAVQLASVADVAASLAEATAIGVLLSLLGVLYPAWVAARMQPVEAMRVEQ
jgi:ABC-type antimicrobial peptide transport system permease subunit